MSLHIASKASSMKLFGDPNNPDDKEHFSFQDKGDLPNQTPFARRSVPPARHSSRSNTDAIRLAAIPRRFAADGFGDRFNIATMQGLAVVGAIAEMAENEVKTMPATVRLASGRIVDGKWLSPLYVQMEFLKKMHMDSLKDVHRKRFRRDKSIRDRAAEKMREEWNTTIAHLGAAKMKSRRLMFDQALPDADKLEKFALVAELASQQRSMAVRRA